MHVVLMCCCRPKAPVYTDDRAAWQPTENFSNIPPPPLSVGSRSHSNSLLDQGPPAATPATPMGYADLGIGSPKGSDHTASKAVTGPQAPRAHIRSADRSLDSGSSGQLTAGSQPATRPRMGQPPGQPPKKPDDDDDSTIV